MKEIKKIFAMFLYLFLCALLMGFDIRKLIDIKQLLIVLLGMILLYLPSYIEQNRTLQPEILGDSALFAGSIQTFILLFMLLSETKSTENLFPNIAQMCRPLLYGFCIWQILDGIKGPRKGKETPTNTYCEDKYSLENQPVPSSPDLTHRLRLLGLSNREVEVAILVTKGMSNAEIAVALCISETTVKKHISNIFNKLEINKREDILKKVNNTD